LAHLERLDQAILALETAVTVAPGMRRARRLLAALYRRTGRDRGDAWKHELAAGNLTGQQLETRG
jgi:hypothetical protein